MADAATIQAQIDSLQAALAAGVLIVQHGTDRVQYQSYSDMRKALGSLQAQLATVTGATPRARVNYIRENKGFRRLFTVNGGRDWTVDD